MDTRVGQQIGNYQLTRLLGLGGFAEVYQATHVHLKSSVAVKLLHSQLRNQDIQAFLEEAQTIAALKHPCIVRVLDFGYEQTLPFLVMEYVSGGTLRDRHPEGTTVALASVVSYVQQVASALACIHTNKLIHRDVKPENMLIDADGKILLSDFGIVTAAHSTTSMKTLDRTGTVPYMAPEQIQGKPRPASDQYALAIVVYEWLCGERPFVGDDPIVIAMKHLSEEPHSLRAKGIPLPSKVEKVILKALSKEPQQRFPDILAFAQALEQASLFTNMNLLTTLLPIFSQKQTLTPAPPAPQMQMHTPTQPVPPPTPQQKKFSVEVLAEEELLMHYILSLREEYSGLRARTTQEAIIDMVKKYAQLFKQGNSRKRITNAFDIALRENSNGNVRIALTISKVEFLNLFDEYEEILLSYIQCFSVKCYNSDVKIIQEAIIAKARKHAQFFQQGDSRKRIVNAFDDALRENPKSNALNAGKIEFLQLFVR